MDKVPLTVGETTWSVYVFWKLFDAINTAKFFPNIIIN